MHPKLNQRHLAAESQPKEQHERAVHHHTRSQLLPLRLRCKQPADRNRFQQSIRRKARNVDANARVEGPHGEGVTRLHQNYNQTPATKGYAAAHTRCTAY